jgi:hypothetical protein
MVPLSSFRKRAHSTEHDAECRKRAREQRPRSLMDLPTEIRRKILSYLLYQVRPVEFNSELMHRIMYTRVRPSDKLLWKATEPTLSLYPHVLRVCRQIYKEGSEILYSNTLNIRVGEPALDPEQHPGVYEYVILQTNMRDSDLVPRIFSRISRVRIQLFAHHQGYKLSESVRRMSNGLWKVISLLDDAPEWTNIEIQLLHIYSNRKLEYRPRKPKDLLPFIPLIKRLRYVRNRASVKVLGLVGLGSSNLATLMTTAKPCFRLDHHHARLEIYIKNVVPEAHVDISVGPEHRALEEIRVTIEDLRRACEEAVDEGNEQKFLRNRNLALKWITTYIITAQGHLLEGEPDHWQTTKPVIVHPDVIAPGPHDTAPHVDEDSESDSDQDDEWDTYSMCSQFDETDRDRWIAESRLIEAIEVRPAWVPNGAPAQIQGL